MNADLVILDDHVARKAAINLGLNVKGTLGIIRSLLLNKQIEIEDFECFYGKLDAIGFRIRRNIFDKIFVEFITKTLS